MIIEKLRENNEKVALIDADIVNPFFRSADAKELLESKGIRVEVPLFANTNIDIPALTGNMADLIRDEDWNVIIDAGGDDLGAKSIGRYREDILSRDYIQFFVMNPNRPFTKNIESADKIFRGIEAASGISFGAIIGNTNLLDETTTHDVIGGLGLLNKIAESKNIPVLYHAVTSSIADQLISEHGDIFNEGNIIKIDRTVKRLF